ncbi:MAG: xylose isomerase [Phycisphaerales bacterium]|nr:xylose isomerase [Phycisphaerales bacterium]
MAAYFPEVNAPIAYAGPDSKDALTFKHYNASEKVLGKTMAEHLRFAVCYWHTFKNLGGDPFGVGTMVRNYNGTTDAMAAAHATLDAAFEFFTKLGVPYWCFHDRDIAPEAETLAETNKRLDVIAGKAKQLQDDTGVKLLWGTSNCFTHPRFMAGAATNPSPHVFAYAAAQIKKAMEITHELGGAGYVFWGGREGYDTLLNTDMGRELDHLARMMHLAADYRKKLGATFQMYIEPKPKEPTKHQYDFDAAGCHAFLLKYGLTDHFKLNIEANHATLAGHTFVHELEYCVANDLLGSIDANRGDMLLGWDTDQFPLNIYDCALAMYTVLRGGGFTTGGLNFDAKLRRQSTEPIDLFHAHIGAMDAFARGLKIAAKMLEDGGFAENVRKRYAGWDETFGKDIENGKADFAALEAFVLKHGEPETQSGGQERLENILNEYMR